MPKNTKKRKGLRAWQRKTPTTIQIQMNLNLLSNINIRKVNVKKLLQLPDNISQSTLYFIDMWKSLIPKVVIIYGKLRQYIYSFF